VDVVVWVALEPPREVPASLSASELPAEPGSFEAHAQIHSGAHSTEASQTNQRMSHVT
jgi:hypothetical protein